MKTTSITFRLTEAEKEKLTRIAKAQDVPVSQLIREAVKKVIQEDREDVSRKSVSSAS